MQSYATLSVMTPLMAMLRSKCSEWLTQFTMLSTFELNQSKTNFIEENRIMAIKNESRHIKIKFLNVCTKVDFEFQKILKYFKYSSLNWWMNIFRKKLIPYFIEYSAHFFTLKMVQKYYLRTIQGR
jgi:hypothetical protein